MNRTKAKGRREGGSFFAIPHAVLNSENYLKLSGYAVKLLNDIGVQFNGANNGDFCIAWKLMEKRGWKSKGTLHGAKQELLHYGMIILTKQGGRHTPSLYAFSWLAIDECKGKLEVSSTRTPPGNWKASIPDFKTKK